MLFGTLSQIALPHVFKCRLTLGKILVLLLCITVILLSLPLCLHYRDPVLFNPGSGMEKSPDSGSGMNIPDHFSESLETVLGLKVLKFFDADPNLGS